MKIKQRLWTLVLLAMLGTAVSNGCNPFAPALDAEGLAGRDVLGDPRTMDGFFELFRNAYELRDTNLYGRLFARDFIFAYYDPDLGQNIKWDRDTELNTSYNLFFAVRQINLDWNYYTQLDTLETEAFVTRNFNLNIEEDEQTVYAGSGRAKFKLRRERPGAPWQAYYWFDESDF